MKIGILGAGGIARVHIKAFQSVEGCEISSIASGHIAKAEAAAAEYGIPAVFCSYEELIDSADIDAVVNCTPNFLHAPLSIRALEKGLHVLCEKPMAVNPAEVTKMMDAAEAAGKLLMPAMCLRFDSRSDAAANFISEGWLGKIYYIKAEILRRDGQPVGWFTDTALSGGGALLDIGVHLLDLGMYLAHCDEPFEISGQVFSHPTMMDGIVGSDKWGSGNHSTVRDADTFGTGLVKFRNGSALSLEAGWNAHREKDQLKLEIYGEKGGISLYPELKFFTNEGSRLMSRTIEFTDPEDPEHYRFRQQAKHFADSGSGWIECKCPAADGLKASKIIDAIYRSSEQS